MDKDLFKVNNKNTRRLSVFVFLVSLFFTLSRCLPTGITFFSMDVILLSLLLIYRVTDDDDDDDANDELLWWNGWPMKGVKLYFQPVRDSHHRQSPTCREKDLNLNRTWFRLCWIKLYGSDNHGVTMVVYWEILMRYPKNT